MQGSFSPFSLQLNAWSNYFDGTLDSITLPTSAALNIGTGSFTIEFWINTNNNNYGVFKLVGTGTTSNGPTVTSTLKFAWWKDGSSEILRSITTAVYGAWYHIAYVRSGTSFKLYVNGVEESTVTNSDSFNFSGWSLGRGYYDNQMFGYLSNFRLTNAAIYTANFSVPNAPLTRTVPSGTVQLLTCQSYNFVDNSINALTLTPVNNVSILPFSPFAPQYAYTPTVTGGSGSFDGTGDYLTVPGNSVFSIGTGNFTVEAWLYQTATNTYPGVLEIGVHTVNGILFIASNGSTITAYGPGGFMGTATAPPLNTWNHIAWVRSGGTFKIYVNGIGNAGVASSSNISDFSVITFGGESTRANAAYTYSGRISSLRVVPNAAVYTANFTPPTAPLTTTVPSGTVQLLTKFTNAGITDNSLKNAVETVADAKVSTSVKKYGSGSMAFDGTGDWLLLPDSPALQMGLGDFTVEGWVYLTATGTARGLVSKGTATTGWSVNITSTNFLQASYTSTNLTGTIPLVANTWYHFAMVRFSSSVGNIKIYLNGALAASSATAITTDFTQTNPLYVGANRVAGEPMLGYMDDVRITKMARYKDSFIPPTIAFARQ